MRSIKDFYNKEYAESFLKVNVEQNNFEKLRYIWIESAPKMEILDIACGPGSVTGELAQKGHHVVGIDFMEEAVKLAKERGLDASVYDVSKAMPFDDNKFDAVIATDILEHVFDPGFMLREMLRILKPGGHAYITFPNHFDLKQRLITMRRGSIVQYVYKHFEPDVTPAGYTHIRFFNHEQMLEAIRSSGFDVDLASHVPVVPQMYSRFNLLIQNRRARIKLCGMFPNLFAGVFRFRLIKRGGV